MLHLYRYTNIDTVTITRHSHYKYIMLERGCIDRLDKISSNRA